MSSSFQFNRPMRLIWPNASKSPNVIIMASNVKRFIPDNLSKTLVVVFVGLLAFQVKGVDAKMVLDRVISITLPYEIHLEKSGPVRLAGLLYEAENKALAQWIKVEDRVRVRLIDDQPDRYGRKGAMVYLPDGRWLQGELVRNGQAVPFPYPGEAFFIRDLYVHERLTALSALDEEMARERFAIVQGMVVEVAEIKGKTYLNFGANWRSDFTVMLAKEAQKKFRASGFDLPTFKGRTLRIRGWVFEKNGPMIAPDDPAQLEVID